MKGLGIIVLMALAFAGGVLANERWDIGSDPASRISDIVGSALDSLGSSRIESVDAAKTELRDLQESSNREMEYVNSLAIGGWGLFNERILRQVCDRIRPLVRDYKRMVDLMRFIEENDPSAAQVMVTLKLSNSQPQIFTAAEIEDFIADYELDLGLVC